MYDVESLGYKLVLMTDTSHDIIILDNSQILGATQLGSFLGVKRERTWERGCTLNFIFTKYRDSIIRRGSTYRFNPLPFHENRSLVLVLEC